MSFTYRGLSFVLLELSVHIDDVLRGLTCFSLVPSVPALVALGLWIIDLSLPLLNRLLELDGLADDLGVGLYLSLFGTWRRG